MNIKFLLFISCLIALVAISIDYIVTPAQKIYLEKQSINSPSEETEHLDFVKNVNLVIDGILYSEDKPAAIIKGAIVHEGDIIQGKKILRIYENGIELEQFGKIWKQQINKPIKTAAKQECYIPSPSYISSVNLKQGNPENDYDEKEESAYLDITYKNRNWSSSLDREQNKRYLRGSYNYSTAPQVKRESLFGNSTLIGSNRFYNVSCSNGEHIIGTTTNIGQFDFHHFSSSNGTSISGTTTNIGKFSFHQFSSSDGINMSGNSTRIGNFDFHNFTTSDGRNINGTSTHIGNFTFNNFNDSVGNSINGTTTNIGNMSFSNFDH